LQKFTTLETDVSCVRHAHSKRCERLLRLLGYQAGPEKIRPLDKSELVELLQQSAVEYMTTFRRIQARDFGSVASVVTVDYEALYAYKRGDYQHCLRLCGHSVRALVSEASEQMPCLLIFKASVQLMDDDIVSLAGLMAIADPSSDDDDPRKQLVVTQRSFFLYLMTQCQMKLRHAKTSLAKTLNYVKLASQEDRVCMTIYTFDQVTLKLTEQKILKYMTLMDTDDIPKH